MIIFPVKIGKSLIEGKGLYALTTIPPRKKIGNFSGKLIPIDKVPHLAKKNKHIAIVELDDKLALDCTYGGNALRYINHSCEPNSYIKIRGHTIECYSLRKIKTNEEITCNYGETHHEGKLKCQCNSKLCKGYI